MAVLDGIISKLNGSAGNLTFKRVSGRTVVSEKATQTTNKRTSGQQRQRMKWANVIEMYKGIAPLINYGFENKQKGVSDYNMFVKINMQNSGVYLTKSEVAGGACVVAPCQISQGSLPAIVVTGTGKNRVTDINLGALTIGSGTTVAQFSNAVVENNVDYNYGDQISFFDIRQRVNAETHVPYAVFNAHSVVLDKVSTATLYSIVDKTGFKSTSGKLGVDAIDENGAFCWVHSRKKNGETLVSSQVLVVNNEILDDYQGAQAYQRAVRTYGGENDTFLTPDAEAGQTSATVTPSPSTGGSTTGGSSQTGGGSSSGGTSSGSQTGGGSSDDDDEEIIHE